MSKLFLIKDENGFLTKIEFVEELGDLDRNIDKKDLVKLWEYITRNSLRGVLTQKEFVGELEICYDLAKIEEEVKRNK